MNEDIVENGVTAHRGNSGELPENTLSAIRSAAELGADWIEIDVLATRDGVVVLSHDKTTGRVGDIDLDIEKTTYSELLAVDAAADFRRRRGLTADECPPARIPTLREVLSFLHGRRTRLSIQPKGDVLDAVLALVRELGMEERTGINDGSLPLLRRAGALEPRLRLFWDRHDYADEAEFDRDLAIARAEGFASLVLRHDTVTPGRIARIREAGIEAGAWTVNRETEMRRLRSMGVERFYTDYPALALNLPEAV